MTPKSGRSHVVSFPKPRVANDLSLFVALGISMYPNTCKAPKQSDGQYKYTNSNQTTVTEKRNVRRVHATLNNECPEKQKIRL